VHDVLAIVCHECTVLGDNVEIPRIVDEVAGAACGVDCS